MNKLTSKQKYNVLGSKDTQYDGIFITAVKTTGIFCRPSCRARTPKFENVIFYDNVFEALQNGFRPCKVCKPMEQNGSTPIEIKKILKELHKNPQLRIDDNELKQRGLEPHTIRRWFKKHYNMTFHSFQRMLRINDAFTNIKNGKSITQSAFGSGYDSLSGFNDSYRSVFGDSACKTKNKSIVNIVRFSTPIGAMFACATEKGICLLEFTDEKRLESLLEDIQKRLNAVILPSENPHLEQVQKELKEYFDGKRKEFSMPLDVQGTD
ncbi:MAG: bifunctional transcriptional activator/DNA repair protein Ada, partial [Ignavibacteriae bacterium]|nr:bifunctional transcriptional activator/DNA repair protein Ada [Ignavibacteriota bacterium]